MRAIALAVALLATSAAAVQAQTAEERRSASVALIENSFGLQYFADVIEASLDARRPAFEEALKQSNPNVSYDAVMRIIMDEFRRDVPRWLPGLINDLAAAYEGLFTHAEILELQAFYATPLGMKVRDTTPELSNVMARLIAVRQEEIFRIIMPRATPRLRALGWRPPGEQR